MTAADERLAKVEIHELLARYCHCRDGLDLDGVLDVFSDDAVFELGAKHGGDLVGKEAIRAHYERTFALPGRRPFLSMHLTVNPWVVLTGEDRAEGRSAFAVCGTDGSSPGPMRFLGIYDDEYRREGGTWRIRQRRVEFTWPDNVARAGRPGQRRAWTSPT